MTTTMKQICYAQTLSLAIANFIQFVLTARKDITNGILILNYRYL
jgi:hypothetical protein